MVEPALSELLTITQKPDPCWTSLSIKNPITGVDNLSYNKA